MSALPLPMDVRAILPTQETLEDMGRRRYQMPNVLKTDGKRPRWYIRYLVDVITAPGQIDRKEATKYLGFVKEMGKREAEKLRDEFMRTVNRPDIVIPSQVPFSHVLGVYREAFLPALKPNSQATYGCAISAHIEPYFEALRLCDIRKETVQAWILTKKDLSVSSRKNLLTALASIWERAVEWDYTQARNPAKGIKVADDGGGRTRDTRGMTLDEVRRLLGAIDMQPDRKDLGLIVRLGVFCGLRIGETLALRWLDIRPPVIRIERARAQYTDEITAPKSTSGRRTVPCPEWLDIQRPSGVDPAALIFTEGYHFYEGQLTRLSRKLNIRWYGFGFHTLRHTYATLMEAAGEKNLKATMGHATDEMSAAYVTRTITETAERQRRIAELLIGSEKTGRA